MGRSSHLLIWSGVIAVLLGFVLPWSQLSHRPVPRSRHRSAQAAATASPRHTASSRAGRVPTRVTGIDIVLLADRKDVRVMTRLAELVTGRRDPLASKAWGVCAVPGLAIGFGLLLSLFGDRRLVAVGIGLACLGALGAGAWGLLTIHTRAAGTLALGSGVWLSLLGYGVIALGAFSAGPEQVTSDW